MVRELQTADLDSLRDIFLSFPHKAAQQRFQGIAPEALADYFVQAERRRLAAEKPSGLRRVAENGGQLLGLAGLQADDWHSRIYGIRFARIAPLLLHRAPASAREDLVGAIMAEAERMACDLVSVRIDGSEFDILRLLQARGFYLVDCSVKLCAPLERIPALSGPPAAKGMAIREYRPEDLPAIRQIAATSHSVNHFYNDPRLPRSATNRLFEAWVERCCASMPSAMVKVLHRGEAPCGFIIFLDPAAFNRALGTRLIILDFVCLAKEIQRGGIGRWFISQSLRSLPKAFNMVELRTSHNNYPALGCYENLGMQIISSDFQLHWRKP